MVVIDGIPRSAACLIGRISKFSNDILHYSFLLNGGMYNGPRFASLVWCCSLLIGFIPAYILSSRALLSCPAIIVLDSSAQLKRTIFLFFLQARTSMHYKQNPSFSVVCPSN